MQRYCCTCVTEFEKYKFQLFESTLPYDEIPTIRGLSGIDLFKRRLPRCAFEFERRVI